MHGSLRFRVDDFSVNIRVINYIVGFSDTIDFKVFERKYDFIPQFYSSLPRKSFH